MKDILESPEVFEAYEKIDFYLLALNELYKENSKPVSAVERFIDVASGYEEYHRKEYKELVIEALEGIIEAKKIIGADYSSEIGVLSKFRD